MKEGWEERPLGEICSILNGLWKGKKEPFCTASVIRNTNFTKDCRLDLSDVAVLEVEEKQLSKRRLCSGDLVLEKSGGGPKQPVGRVVYFDQDEGVFSFSNFTSALRVNDPDEIWPVYLHWFLYWIYLSGCTEPMQRRSTGIRNLDMSAYKAIAVSYPPLPEQRRIVAILDEAFEGIAAAKANAERNLKNAREVFEAYRDAKFVTLQQEAFLKPMLEIVDEVATGPFGSLLHKTDYEIGGVPLVNPINIEDDSIVADERKTVGAATASRLSRYCLAAGDIAVGRRGDIGRCAVVSLQQEGWLCGTGCFVIRTGQGVEPEFLANLLRSRPYRMQLVAKAGRATMPSISNKDLASLKIPALSQEQQKNALEGIAELRDFTNQTAAIVGRKISALDELKASLLHQAFTGNL